MLTTVFFVLLVYHIQKTPRAEKFRALFNYALSSQVSKFFEKLLGEEE